jgi:hypothetical protein
MTPLFELNGLAAIDWPALGHAYGSAIDTPTDLRGLTSAMPELRAHALQQREMSICHQGSLYSATAPAIPFLLTAAEQLSGEEQADTATVFGLDLVGLIIFIAESASCTPGAIAETVHSNWSLFAETAGQPDPRKLAVGEIAIYRTTLGALVDNRDRLQPLIENREPDLISNLIASAQLAWSGDFVAYTRAIPAFSAGVAETVLAQPVDQSYKTLAERLGAGALSSTMLWWAFEQESSDDLRTLAADSLARDLVANVHRGWRTGLHHARQTTRFWKIWSQRFINHADCVARVRDDIEQHAPDGWLPRSREDELIANAVRIGFEALS